MKPQSLPPNTEMNSEIVNKEYQNKVNDCLKKLLPALKQKTSEELYRSEEFITFLKLFSQIFKEDIPIVIPEEWLTTIKPLVLSINEKRIEFEAKKIAMPGSRLWLLPIVLLGGMVSHLLISQPKSFISKTFIMPPSGRGGMGALSATSVSRPSKNKMLALVGFIILGGCAYYNYRPHKKLETKLAQAYKEITHLRKKILYLEKQTPGFSNQIKQGSFNLSLVKPLKAEYKPNEPPYSMINNGYLISYDCWVVSIIRIPSSTIPKHAFIFIEGLDAYGRGVMMRYELFKHTKDTSPEKAKRSLAYTLSNIKFDIPLEQFEDVFYSDDFYVGYKEVYHLSWPIAREKVIKWYQEGLQATIGKDIPYHILGNISSVAWVSRATGHNCFTWAREKLLLLNEKPVTDAIKEKSWDYIGADPCSYIKKCKSLNLI